MFILYGMVLGLGVGILLGGRPVGLARLHLRWAPLALLGFAIQLVLFAEPVAARVGDLGAPLYVASTGLVLLAVLRNGRVRGMAIVAIGATCNLVVIIANGGAMPTTARALAQVGRLAGVGFSNSTTVDQPRLAVLTDIFAMPRWLPSANVFSIGDVLIGLGVAVTIAAAMRAGRMASPPSDADPGAIEAPSATDDSRPATPSTPSGPSEPAWARGRLPVLSVVSVTLFFLVLALHRDRP